MGPFRKSRNGNSYIIIGIDFYSKFVEASPTVSFDALITAIFAFNVVMCRHGVYEKVLTDRGVNFESHLFQHLCQLMGSKKVRTTSCHAQCNGGTDVVNKVIKPCLAKLIDTNHEDWDVYLPMAVSSYNNAFHTSIGMTPFEAHFGRPGYLVSDLILNNPLPASTSNFLPTSYRDVSEYTIELWNNSQRLNAIIRSNLEAAHKRQKTNYDKSVKDSRIFALGDAVKLINYSKKIGKSSCFQDKFLGPFRIVDIKDVTYTLRANDGRTQTLHYNRLLPYFSRDHTVITPVSLVPEVARFWADTALLASSEVSTLRRSSRIFAKLCAINKGKLMALTGTINNNGNVGGGMDAVDVVNELPPTDGELLPIRVNHANLDAVNVVNEHLSTHG